MTSIEEKVHEKTADETRKRFVNANIFKIVTFIKPVFFVEFYPRDNSRIRTKKKTMKLLKLLLKKLQKPGRFYVVNIKISFNFLEDV